MTGDYHLSMIQMIIFLFELMAAGKKLDKIGIRDNDRPEGVATFVITTEEKDVLNSLLL